MEKTILAIVMLLLLATTARGSDQTHDSDEQLQEVVVWSGKRKLKGLSSRGTRIPGAVSVFTPDKVGYEVSTALDVKHPFEVEEIEFFIISNSIRNVKLQVAIYRDGTFTEMLGHPIVVDIPEGNRQRIVATPAECTLLEPGDYIVSIGFADCDEKIQQQWTNSDQWNGQKRYMMATQQRLQFPLYLKAGQIRSNPDDAFEKSPTNIGLKVKGNRLD